MTRSPRRARVHVERDGPEVSRFIELQVAARVEADADGDALKHAALSLESFSKRGGAPDGRVPERERPREAARPPATSRPSGSAEPLTDKQLGAINGIARKAGLSRDRLADLLKSIAGKDDPSRLTKEEASLVIDRLKALADA